jgi:hypothetical protein
MIQNSNEAFRTAMPGSEPAEVDQRLAERATAEVAARHAVDTDRSPGESSFGDVGARIAQLLSLASEAADELRAAATAELSQRLLELDATSARTIADAGRYADQRRAAADHEAARILEEARRTADRLVEEADRQAAARRAEAETVYEGQRAQAAQAASDLEQALAQRRNKVEHELQLRTAIAERQLSLTREHAEQVRAETDHATAEAARTAAAVIADAERRAEQLVADAVARAAQLRSESERELAATIRRRDSISYQLANVRQMLATLTGTSGPDPTVTLESPGSPTPAAVTGAGSNRPRSAD